MRDELSQEVIERILALFPEKTETRGRKPINRVSTLRGILYVLRTGCPWRDLPECYGHWQSVYGQFNRWNQRQVWQQVHEALAKEADLEMCYLDSTTAVVHQQGLGAKGGKNSRPSGKV
jgi:transposase